MVVESEWKTEGRVMLLQQSVSVSALVQGRHGRLQLLKTRLLRLLNTPPAGQVTPYHTIHREMETKVAALPGEQKWEKKMEHTCADTQ